MNAQSVNLADSLRNVFSYKPVPTAKLDSRNSFISGRGARIQGIKAGFSFGNRLTLGVGYNWLGRGFTERVQMNDTQYEAELKLRYVAPFIEYSFFKKGPWEATVPLQIGFGRSYLKIKELGSGKKFSGGNVILYEPSMTIEYKVFNLIGFGGGLGYRVMLKNNREIDHDFTSPIYVIRVRIIFDELYRRIKEK